MTRTSGACSVTERSSSVLNQQWRGAESRAHRASRLAKSGSSMAAACLRLKARRCAFSMRAPQTSRSSSSSVCFGVLLLVVVVLVSMCVVVVCFGFGFIAV